ncbi:hypothetical protein [Macrococcus animalis]|uniref:hypothetical protein n=1 Tax=Macrococcus animalis TaxID=3395467 RepID=UPI0039BE54B8
MKHNKIGIVSIINNVLPPTMPFYLNANLIFMLAGLFLLEKNNVIHVKQLTKTFKKGDTEITVSNEINLQVNAFEVVCL